MTLEVIAWSILGVIVPVQQWLIAQMTSKLMARNFAEYTSGVRQMSAKPKEKVKDESEFDDYAATQAQKANQLFRA